MKWDVYVKYLTRDPVDYYPPTGLRFFSVVVDPSLTVSL